jgi:hypothetical protein
MKISIALLFLLAVTSPLSGQSSPEKRWGVEAAFGPGQTLEGFTSDCCGPTRKQNARVMGIRIVRRASRFAEWSADGGANLVAGRDMQWIMLAGSLTGSATIAPWVRVGMGAVAQRGECPADASDLSPDCRKTVKPGGQVAVGTRWQIGRQLAVGVETGLVRGISAQEHHFTSRRLGATMRWMW